MRAMASAFGLIVQSACRDQFGQRQCVFEAAIHALPVEGHDRVRRIADQQGATFQVPAVQPERAEQAGGMAEEIAGKVVDQADGIRELGGEEGRHGRGRIKTGETRFAFAGTACR
jgi:hypothetical protein